MTTRGGAALGVRRCKPGVVSRIRWSWPHDGGAHDCRGWACTVADRRPGADDRRTMTTSDPAPVRTRLKLYRFGPDARPAGELVGAVERMALTGQTRIEDALCVARTLEDGELAAIDLALAQSGAGLSDLLDFRLAPDRRRALTARALMTRPGGVPASVIRAIGEVLEPGAAVVAFLVTAAATPVLDDAVARCNGRLVADEETAARTLPELGALLADRAGPVGPPHSTTRGSPPYVASP
jgi:hypothetical protein